MVEAVKAGMNIALHNPFHAREGGLHLQQRGVATAFGTKSMRVAGEYCLVNRFLNPSDDFLNQLVISGRNSQRALLFAVFLGNVYTPCWVRLVGMVFERGNEDVDAFHAHGVKCLSICAGRHAPRGGSDVFVRQQIEFRIVQIAV